MNRSINRFLCLLTVIILFTEITGCNKAYDVSISNQHASDVPLNVQLLDHTNKTLTVAWDYIDGATSYVVQLLEDPQSNNPLISYVTHTEDYHIFNSLESRKAYYARVRANFENSATSDWVYVTLNNQTAKIIPVYGAVNPDFEIPYFKIIDSSSSTITAEWSFTGFDDPDSEVGDSYSVYLYSDADAQNLVISWENISGLFAASTSATPKPMRFTFSGLTPSKPYYLKVIDKTSSLESTIKKVNTAAALSAAVSGPSTSGDIVLSEDFSKFIHGGDILFRAAGYTVGAGSGRAAYSPASGENPVDADIAQATCDQSIEFNVFDGGSVTADYTAGVGMAGWGKSGNTSTKPGYIKMGGNKGLASLYTPELSSLSSNADLAISFKVGVYAEYGTSYTDKVLVQAVRGALFSDKGAVSNAGSVEVLASQVVTIDEAQEVFKNYTVSFNNIPKDARIVISSDPDDLADNKTRFLLDDIQVKIK